MKSPLKVRSRGRFLGYRRGKRGSGGRRLSTRSEVLIRATPPLAQIGIGHGVPWVDLISTGSSRLESQGAVKLPIDGRGHQARTGRRCMVITGSLDTQLGHQTSKETTIKTRNMYRKMKHGMREELHCSTSRYGDPPMMEAFH